MILKRMSHLISTFRFDGLKFIDLGTLLIFPKPILLIHMFGGFVFNMFLLINEFSYLSFSNWYFLKNMFNQGLIHILNGKLFIRKQFVRSHQHVQPFRAFST